MHYVKGMYLERFGNPHVGIDIIQYVAEMMTKLYPSLRDEDSSEDNPTFVSLTISVDWLPYMTKLHMEFYLAIWLRLAKFTE